MALDDVVIFTFRFRILVSIFSFGISEIFTLLHHVSSMFLVLFRLISFFSGWVLDFI